MFEVTEKASEMIKDYVKDKEMNLAIRIMMNQGGWSGPSLGLALDESHDDDEVFMDRGIKYVVNKTILDQVKPITVDYINSPRGSGFKLISSMDAIRSCTPSCSCWLFRTAGEKERQRTFPPFFLIPHFFCCLSILTFGFRSPAVKIPAGSDFSEVSSAEEALHQLDSILLTYESRFPDW